MDIKELTNLKKPVTQKVMYIAILISFVIGIWFGQSGYLKDIIPSQSASIVEPIVYANIGDHIKIICSNTEKDSDCSLEGTLMKGYRTPYTVIWDRTGGTTNYVKQLQANQTITSNGKTFHNITLEVHNLART